MSARLKNVINRVKKDINKNLDLLILYILSKLEGTDVSELKIQKIMYLLSKHDPSIAQMVKFEPYLKGAYSEEISYSLSKQVNIGLLKSAPHSKFYRVFTLTDEGRVLSQFIVDKASKIFPPNLIDLIDKLNSIIEFSKNLSEEEFLIYLYTLYPDDAVHSELKDYLDKNRLRLAVRMYKEGKVSLSMAAKIAGVPLSDFIKILREKKIKIPLSE